MSRPNMFNGNLAETDINSAYQFHSFSQYINSGGLRSQFSPKCIFCSSSNTVNLMTDGSLKHCNQCKKQFKPFFR